MQSEPINIKTRLADGTALLLRPWMPTDIRHMTPSLRELARPLGYTPYFMPAAPVFNEEPQGDFFPPADERQQSVYVAIDPAAGKGNVLAVGRLNRLLPKPWVAEVSLAVDLPYQRRGLGRMMFGLIHLAAESAAIRNLRVLAQLSNQPAVEWVKRLGASSRLFLDEIIELDLPICQDPVLLPQNASCRSFRAVMDQLEEALSIR